jgi:hypothetical protein
MPCLWPVIPCGPLPEEDDPRYEGLSDAAGEVIWALSGRQFGCCETTTMLCSAGCEPADPGDLPWGPASPWVLASCRSCQGLRPCQHGGPYEVYLPGPVCEVVEVRVAGDAVPTGSYRVDDLHWLVRTDGGSWPAGARPGDWTATYTQGVPVPAGGQRAKGELMSELWKACNGDKDCALPKRVQVIARQGITFGTLDPMDFLREGKTGLYFTDLWLSAVNPDARSRGARIASPDWEPGRTGTWP